MASENLVGSVLFKTSSGVSLVQERARIRARSLDRFRPALAHRDPVENRLRSMGFQVEAITDVGLSFSGPRALWQEEFGVKIRRSQLQIRELGGAARAVPFYKAPVAVLESAALSPHLEGVELATPGIPFHLGNPPAPNPNFYFLNVLTDVPDLVGATAPHASGITGAGVRVSMVDTGFVTRVTEVHNATGSSAVTVDHRVRAVSGVWLATDPNHTGTNYFTGGSFANSAIQLGHALPTPNVPVQVEYSCLHPHYLAQGYAIDDLRAVSTLDINTDEYGHGTAEAANALAVAPGCTFSFVKYSDGGWSNFPLLGFQAAVQHQSPDIITCSWGTTATAGLFLEIANAVANGVVVIFAAGNGHLEADGAIAHPDLISVGGAYPIQGGGLRASNYASSYDSTVWTTPQRVAPDVCGLVGETPRAALIMLPTEPDNDMDNSLSASAFPNGDNTDDDDGWVVCSGTSAAAPQTAGVAALLLQQHPGLSPAAVKNILQSTAVDVTTGSSANGDAAGTGWDAATGHGLVNAAAALGFLHAGAYNGYIRDSIEDNGTEPVVASRLWASPDIIVRREPVADTDELGATLRHRYDLSEDAESGQENQIYLRVQNRGALAGSSTATVYVTDPGMFHDPSSWTNIGSVGTGTIPPGELVVVGPLAWPNAQIPGLGHFCLIAILDSPSDPAPDLGAIHSAADFTDMVRTRNNVAWKNITIADLFPGMSSSFSFTVEGPSGAGHRAELKVDAGRFAAGGKVLTRVVKRLTEGASLSGLSLASSTALHATLALTGAVGRLGDMPLESRERSLVKVEFGLPEDAPDGDYPIIATLFIDGANVGSFTHVARVTRFNFVGNRSSRELHRRSCVWVGRMALHNRLAFADLPTAHAKGYDNCAFCLGDSKR